MVDTVRRAYRYNQSSHSTKVSPFFDASAILGTGTNNTIPSQPPFVHPAGQCSKSSTGVVAMMKE
jgi:hypothetical protein